MTYARAGEWSASYERTLKNARLRCGGIVGGFVIVRVFDEGREYFRYIGMNSLRFIDGADTLCFFKLVLTGKNRMGFVCQWHEGKVGNG